MTEGEKKKQRDMVCEVSFPRHFQCSASKQGKVDQPCGRRRRESGLKIAVLANVNAISSRRERKKSFIDQRAGAQKNTINSRWTAARWRGEKQRGEGRDKGARCRFYECLKKAPAIHLGEGGVVWTGEKKN